MVGLGTVSTTNPSWLMVALPVSFITPESMTEYRVRLEILPVETTGIFTSGGGGGGGGLFIPALFFWQHGAMTMQMMMNQ